MIRQNGIEYGGKNPGANFKYRHGIDKEYYDLVDRSRINRILIRVL